MLGMLAVTALAFFVSRQQIEAADWVARTERAIARLESIESDLLAAESTGRAFVLTGASDLPARFSSLLRGALDELDALARLLRDNPRQQQNIAELRPYIGARFAVMQEMIDARQHVGLDAGIEIAKRGTGRAGMAAIKTRIAAMMEYEQELLDIRMTQHARVVRLSHGLLIAIVIVGSVVLTLLFRLNMRELSRRLQAEALAKREARHDALTGLGNRRSLLERLETAIPSAQRHGHRLALVYVDLDGFKHVNDSMGHAAGDELLRQAAERLSRNTRAEDILARLGGDEFLIAVPFVQWPSEVAVLSARMIETLSRPFALPGGEARVTASIGVAIYPDHGDNIEELVASADAALYAAKANGKGAYHFPAHARKLHVA
jgi:diguanylate cyclase (GGDEF)-like protein